MSFDYGKGHRLEQHIALFLDQHGYTVQTNVLAPGRSGAIHELDVVGDKSDDLTSYRLVVECKAWAAAIDKEVVYKLAAELADLGAARGIIVAPSGWTVQAAQAAAQANIELWGRDELSARFGVDALREIQASWAQVGSLGLEFTIPVEAARQALERAARGKLGFARDEVAWVGQVWLPVWLLQLAITKLEGAFRKVPRVTRSWNGYDGLAGQLIEASGGPPTLVTVNVSSGYIRPPMQQSAVTGAIKRAFDQWRAVTTEPAKRRHAAALAQMGLHVPFTAISVETATLIYHPLWIAFLRKGPRERIAAVDGTSGREQVDMGRALTAHAHLVRESLTAK
jgi:Restriction endonuclease